MIMRKLITYILLNLFFTSISCQVIKQQGFVYQYHGKDPKTLLVNTQILANDASPAISGNNGMFTLLFSRLNIGDKISGVKINKKNCLIFNQDVVNGWSVRKAPLKLILCNIDLFYSIKRKVKKVSEDSYKEKYAKKCKEYFHLLEQKKISEDQYEKEMTQARILYENTLKKIDEYADLFARIDESEMDKTAQTAMELFKNGEVDKAISLMEKLHPGEKLDSITERRANGDSIRIQAQSEINRLIPPITKAAKIFMDTGMPEKAKQYINEAILADTTIKNRLICMRACIFLKMFCEAEKYSKDILLETNQDSLLVHKEYSLLLHLNLAHSLLFQGKFEEATTIYLKYKSELKQSFLDDFNEFERQDVIPKECDVDVEKIRKLLTE